MSSGDGPQGLHRWVGVVGLFVAPTTIITSVCVYFGLASTQEYYKYFGIDSNAIGFTSADHVTKSISVLYAPILALLIVWAALIWAAVYIRRLATAGRGTGPIRNLGWVAIGIGTLGALRGVVGVLRPQFELTSHELLTPVTLGAGTALVVVGCWMLSITRAPASDAEPRPYVAARRVSLFVAAAVTVMALFWVANIFATFYGEYHAKKKVAELWENEEGVVLDTTDRLNLPASLVVETRLGIPARTDASPATEALAASQASDGPVTYRYQCFRSVAVRGDRWVLVPAKWTPEFGYAVIVFDDSSNRISVTRRQGIADTGAVDWDESGKDDGWQCPEVAPPSAYALPASDHALVRAAG